METVILSRWQFATTTVYHFFFVPLTLGLSILVAIMETIYVRTGDEEYKRMVKFFGKLFIINFAMGVVTGIVQEFQFGMNWADYARFIGDIFGAPLAIEGLLAFFLESTFLGVWVFGWERLSKPLHAAAIWLVAIGTNLSAFFILTANSFMQRPVGYQLVGEKVAMVDFSALLKNPYLWGQFPHAIFSGYTTAAVFVACISVYHLLKKNNEYLFKRALKISSIFGLIAVLSVVWVGDAQGQRMFAFQPMKIAAAEGLWETENPASFSLLTLTRQHDSDGENLVDIRVPYILSFLAFHRPSGEVKGISDLQDQYEKVYGPGNYVPNIMVLYWVFRVMVGMGFLMIFGAAYLTFLSWRKKSILTAPLIKLVPYAIVAPYFANTSGWVMTEMGRQPWVVYGLMKTQNAVSPTLSSGMVLASLIGFILLYGCLMVADLYLLIKYAKAGPQDESVNSPAIVS
jgi:cytochrome bd ubiquinol oxidase subunit I